MNEGIRISTELLEIPAENTQTLRCPRVGERVIAGNYEIGAPKLASITFVYMASIAR